MSDNNSEPDKKDLSGFISPDSTWTPKDRPNVSKKDDRDEYSRRFLAVRKIKDYTPVYIDVRMKDKLQTLISSLQHLAPEITPTMLLSNLLADHIASNRELITRVANEGLKRSLANTFEQGKE